MAGYPSRISFTVISSCIVALSLIWYSRKKKFSCLRKSVKELGPDSKAPEINSSQGKTTVDAYVIHMNLKEQQEADLAQQMPCSSQTSATEAMQLKGKSQESDFVGSMVKESTENVELNGSATKKICNGNDHHDGENGTTCDTVARTNGVSTNGTSPPCDNTSDKEDCSVSSESDEHCEPEANGCEAVHETIGCETISLTNGVATLCLDEDVAVVQDMPNGQTVANGDVVVAESKRTDASSQTPECTDKPPHTMNIFADTFVLTKHSELSDNLPSLTDLADRNSNELSCQTDFDRKSVTPDSGVSAELADCGSPCSTLSEPQSESPLSRIEGFKSPTNESSNECGNEDGFDVEGATASGGDADAYPYPSASENGPINYDFEIPQKLCGYLIGRGGRNVKYLIHASNAAIMVNGHPVFENVKVCRISGNEEEIKCALSLIRKKFPLDNYPALTLDAINPLQTECTLPVTVKLSLPQGVTFDVILSSTISPAHIFLQQPTHPTYHSLSWLTQTMTSWYIQYDAPKLFNIAPNHVVAVSTTTGWYRAQVIDIFPETEECTIKFLDFGGYSTVLSTELRQIRMEFSYVPFQAVECYLGNITYPEGESKWSDEAKVFFEELAKDQILEGYIAGYEGEIPYVHLYKVRGEKTIFINRELVVEGLARWISLDES